MPDSPTSQPEFDFVCDCEKWDRSACAGEPFYKEHEGNRYCVLHFRGGGKSADFEKARRHKLEKGDFHFEGVWFPNFVSFAKFDFTADAHFRSATFSEGADFGFATFSGFADFSRATFSAEADFGSATFKAKCYFNAVTFSAPAYFNKATFSAAADLVDTTFSAVADFDRAAFDAANFRSATFNAHAHFSYATFSGDADFLSATFSSVRFAFATFSALANFSRVTVSGETDFQNSTFSAQADFRSVTFNKPADFTSATFRAKAYFFSTTFEASAIFSRATFADANFTFAIFSAVVSFNEAIFANYVEFAGNQDRQPFSKNSSLDLQFATIEKSDRVSFHTLRLHPHWFVNIDPRKFDFTNVKWNNSGKAKPELELLIAKTPQPAADSPSASTGSDKTRRDQIKKLHRLLSQACQRLAANCEENARYRKASHFRRMAQDAERLETWHGFDFRKLNWWYWLASGYGERPFQALLVLVGILVVFGLLYTQVGFAQWEPRLASEADVATAKKDEVGAPLLPFRRALTYSAAVLTFQRPEPKPATTTAQAIVLLETILGPVQAALLALAIRRKFMR